MENPQTINSVDASQFGFQTDFYPADKKIVFDISALTIFNTGGAALAKGVAFTITDPSGLTIHTPDWNLPDIDPDVSTQFTFNVTSGFAMWGWWQIIGTFQDSTGQQFKIYLKKEVRRPKEMQSDGTIKAEFNIEPNCDVPQITVSEISNLAYCGKEPDYTLVNGMFYYPQGTLDPIAFSTTPFIVGGVGKVYTGTYTIRSKTDAAYNLGDYFYVHLYYAGSKEQKVTCTLDMCRLLCCVEKLQQTADENCGTNIGNEAKKKLDDISVDLWLAASKDKCGQDASALVQKIFDQLGCDCDCENEIIQPAPIGGNVTILGFEGTCATKVTPTVTPSGVKYTIQTKAVAVSKPSGDNAFKITRVEDDCSITYVITWDYVELSRTILTTIKNNQDLLNLLNSMISINLGFDFSGIDGMCIIDTKTADYSLSEKLTGVEIATSIIIDSTLFPAPGNLVMNNQVALSAWLNSLGKGAFNVYYNPTTNTTLISSTQNKSLISTLNVTIDGAPTARQFVRIGVDLLKLLQAIITYVCKIAANQVQMGKALSVCSIGDDGKLKTTPFTATSMLIDFLSAQSDAQCKLVQQLINVQGLNCDRIKAVFLVTSNPFLPTDVFYGTKDSKCAPITRKEAATAMLNEIFADATLYQLLCDKVNACNQPKCLPVTNVTVTMDNGVTCTQVTDIEATVE